MTAVLLHPVGLDRGTWDGVRVDGGLAVDLPGHGDSPWVALRNLDDVADHLVRSLGATSVIDLVGVSLGGMVALHAALRHPDRIRSVVVACAPAGSPKEVMLQRAVDTELLGMQGVLDSTLSRWFSPEVLAADPPYVEAVRRRLEADDPRVVGQYWQFIAAHELSGRLGEIAVPATVIAGSADVSVPPRAARALAEGLPDAEYLELPGAHMLHLEAPREFEAAVRRHLDRVEAAAA